MTQKQEAQDAADLAAHPVSYATVVDHYREMARRFAESRDELKHRCRELEQRLERMKAGTDRDELQDRIDALTTERDNDSWHQGWKVAVFQRDAAERELARLQQAIREHRDARGDDRCWRDDHDLYATLPEGFTPPVMDTTVELARCEQYITARRHPGTEYVSPQREIDRLQQGLRALQTKWKAEMFANTAQQELIADVDALLATPAPPPPEEHLS